MSSGKPALLQLQKKPEEGVGLVSRNSYEAHFTPPASPAGSIATPVRRASKLRLGPTNRAQALKASTEESEAGRFLCAQGQPGIHSETLAQSE